MRMMSNAAEAFEAYDYPMTTEELIEAEGDMTLELPNGTETLRDALSRSAPETFETAEDARLTAYAGVSSKAIGRKGYSDRDPVCMGEDGPEEVSF
ncbi:MULTISPECIES: DUF5789 family protein [Haloarcula]|uniref:DUF2795 domain-containing protein n=1 Tax=Haloarcula pellucida TaxID=1427151 RepID=A0A830GQH0_9EURY|nr:MULTISPECIES: DUF2795 domain-containing protein [Halomicroarcula]MBX0349225.1 DUF2795 domain-containing protein [Halomicroarcula pellucida]MDS0279184.1 DUF2795 domain-containing protein [Halomicroarcula sp. S1AR25-4]GGN99592.1 hypothetical protein GCM10009030_31320 [Halomicroarcula pellucida]